jgi:hypothetical protein
MTIKIKHVAVGLCIFLLIIGIIMVSVKPTTDINKEKSYKNIINKTKTIGSVLIVVSCIALILLRSLIRSLKENKNSFFCPCERNDMFEL